MSRAVLHIGLPKTGTSYVQRSLVQHREALAGSGVDVLNVPGGSQHHAAWDLLGRRIGGADPGAVEGAWSALAERAGRSPHPCVVLSDEFLVHARPTNVRAVARALSPREVHVVVTVRDLRRAITSMWGQNTRKGRTIRWSDYVAAVRDPSSGPPTSGVAFWLRYDVPRVLETWSDSVRHENVRVVIVPPSGSPPQLLMERFGEAAGLDLTGFRQPAHHVHASASAYYVEVLRRLNEDLRERLTEAQYLAVVADLFRPASAALTSRPGVAFPQEHRDWVEERSEELVDWLSMSPYTVVGNLGDLRPGFDGATDVSPDDLDEDAINDATRELMVASMVAYATSGSRRRRGGRDQHRPPPRHPGERVRAGARPSWRSRLRARTFRARVAALERADRNRVLAKAAHAYLRLTGQSRRRVR